MQTMNGRVGILAGAFDGPTMFESSFAYASSR